ncbi:MAG: GtrA family protein [Frankiales bacterium]|jgi:putative flippase GtrA|nr:GtrA family protein [Frankiales bacterium]
MAATTPAPSGALRNLEARIRAAFHELAKFGTVGAFCFLVDISLFNLVLHLTDKPLTSKVASTVVAASIAFVLNRAWSFRHRQRSSVRREYALFFVLNAIGLVIAVGCLAISHYLLGFESKLADNIAANGFGLVLGTTFRFWSYRRFVWAAPDAVEAAAVDGDPAAVAVLEDVEDGTITRPAS